MQIELHDETTHPLENKDRGVGLEQLLLSLMKLLHDLMEKQVLRRMERGHFSEAELNRLGDALCAQDQQIDVLCEHFKLSRESLELLKILDIQGNNL